MKILFVHGGADFGGGNIYILGIAAALLKKGCDVVVLYCNRDIPEQMKVRMSELNARLIYQEYNVLKPDAKIFNRRFSMLLNEVRPDVIVFNRSGGAGWSKFSDLITTARLKGGCRLVAVEHGHPCPFPVRRGKPFYNLRKRFHCWLQARCLDAIVCMNFAARDILLNTGYSYPKKRLHVIYHGIDISRFRFDAELRALYRKSLNAGTKTVVLYCGRLLMEKGPDLLLKAWICLNEQERKDMLLVIVGEGPMMTDLRKDVEHRGISDTVRFVGFQHDVRGYLCASDIFVCPSRAESFGLSLAEAMAVGRYAIATKVGGIPELLSSTRMGVLVAPESPQEIASAILTAAKDPARLELGGKMAAAHIAENFSEEASQSATISVLLTPKCNID